MYLNKCKVLNPPPCLNRIEPWLTLNRSSLEVQDQEALASPPNPPEARHALLLPQQRLRAIPTALAEDDVRFSLDFVGRVPVSF